jgi:lysozyme
MIKPAVIDLSHHNTVSPSFALVKEIGVLGVIHKASEGSTIIDKTLEARAWMANEAGLLFGVYHFLRPGDPQKQLDNFLAQAGKIENDNTLFALDYEDRRVPLDTVVWFLKALADATRRAPVLYTGFVLKEKLKAPNLALSSYRLWLAQYGPKAVMPIGFKTYWLWQYSDKGPMPGVNTGSLEVCDVNAYEGSAEQLRDEWSGRLTPAEPKPEPDPKKVTTTFTITVTSSGPVEIEVTKASEDRRG